MLRYILIISFFFFGCTKQQTPFTQYSTNSKAQLYSGDKLIKEWNVAGLVTAEDGYFRFRDKDTSKFIRISGTVIVTQE